MSDETGLSLRILESAIREAEWRWPGLRLDPRTMSCAFRALADYTLLLHAGEHNRDGRFPSDSPADIAGRTGLFMHLIADMFHDLAVAEESRDATLLATAYAALAPPDERRPTVELEHTNVRLVVHDESLCAGQPCTVHNRSDHHMRSMPQHWRFDRGLMERICPHGVGHPDVDSPPGTDFTHGCCGCCTAGCQ